MVYDSYGEVFGYFSYKIKKCKQYIENIIDDCYMGGHTSKLSCILLRI